MKRASRGWSCLILTVAGHIISCGGASLPESREIALEGAAPPQVSTQNQHLSFKVLAPPEPESPAREEALDEAAESGVVSLIQGSNSQGSPFASVFGRDDAVGNDPDTVLGGLYGES